MPHRSFIFRIQALVLMLLVLNFIPFSAVLASDPPAAGTELLKNGDFSGEMKFQIYKESGGKAGLSIADGELQVDVESIGRVGHAIQPYYDGFGLYEGAEYILSFDARSTFPRSLFVRVQVNGGDYHAYFEAPVSLTVEMRHYSFSFIMKEKSDPAPRLCINMGYVDAMSAAGLAPEDIPPHQVYFDNFSLTVGDVSGISEESNGAGINPIRISQ